jgi:hypothetical protein
MTRSKTEMPVFISLFVLLPNAASLEELQISRAMGGAPACVPIAAVRGPMRVLYSCRTFGYINKYIKLPDKDWTE